MKNVMNKLNTLALGAVLSLLSACGAGPATSIELQNHSADREFLHEQAELGNAEAQLLLGNLYCTHEPAENKGMETVKWWTQAATRLNSKADATIAAVAMEKLGKYYLSLHDNDAYDPAKDQSQAPCTGRAAGDSDIESAEKWFTSCAESGETRGAACEMWLGHTNSIKKDHQKAYFWYAAVLATSLPPMTPATTPEQQAHTGVLPLDEKFYGEGSTDLRNAKRAARHLSKAQVTAISDEALKWEQDKFNRFANAQTKTDAQ